MQNTEIKRGYKVLNADGSPHHGGSSKWRLPVGEQPGEWMPEIVDIALCKSGYHFCRDERDLLQWLGPTIWRVEVRGAIIEGDDKAVASQARLIESTLWSDKIARLFAADCAEQVLDVIPPELREICARTIAVARDFARGSATTKQLADARAAAWTAARDAGGDASAWSAAWAAARGVAAGDAIGNVVGDAAWSAARAAAGDAAKDAVGDVVGDVVGDDAGAGAGAWSAAWCAAGAAAREWQVARLQQYLGGELA